MPPQPSPEAPAAPVKLASRSKKLTTVESAHKAGMFKHTYSLELTVAVNDRWSLAEVLRLAKTELMEWARNRGSTGEAIQLIFAVPATLDDEVRSALNHLAGEADLAPVVHQRKVTVLLVDEYDRARQEYELRP